MLFCRNRKTTFVDILGYSNSLRFEPQKIFPNQFLLLANKLSYMLSQKYNGKK